VGFIYGLEEKYSKSEVIFAVCRLPSAVNVMLNLSNNKRYSNSYMPALIFIAYRGDQRCLSWFTSYGQQMKKALM